MAVGNLAPFLLTLLLNNQNNNNNPPLTNQPIPDTLHAKHYALEYKTPNVPDGSAANDTKSRVIADTLVATTVALEVKQSPILKLRGETSIGIAPPSTGLNDDQKQFWQDNGYLVIPNALSDHVTRELLQSVYNIAEFLAADGEHVEKLSYLPGQSSYVSPMGRVIATLTEDGLKPDSTPLQRIQRLGCGIHRVLPNFRNIVMREYNLEIAKTLGYTDPRVTQSLVLIKASKVGAEVVPHQDGCSGFTDPPSCTTFWYALEDATIENGCLAVAPGSHRTTPITKRSRKDKTGRPELVDLATPLFAQLEDSHDKSSKDPNMGEELVFKKLEVKAGTLILMHGNLMHMSEGNKSGKSRVAFNFGIVEGTNAWLVDNYIQPYDSEAEFERLQFL